MGAEKQHPLKGYNRFQISSLNGDVTLVGKTPETDRVITAKEDDYFLVFREIRNRIGWQKILTHPDGYELWDRIPAPVVIKRYEFPHHVPFASFPNTSAGRDVVQEYIYAMLNLRIEYAADEIGEPYQLWQGETLLKSNSRRMDRSDFPQFASKLETAITLSKGFPEFQLSRTDKGEFAVRFFATQVPFVAADAATAICMAFITK